jgi:hypothetical protein
MKIAIEDVAGGSWTVERCAEEGQPTLIQLNEAATAAHEAEIRKSPLVAAVMAAFPEAEEIKDEDRFVSRGRGERNWSQRK